MKREGSTDGGVSWRADVPDSVDVLDGVADLLAELFLIKLHLQQKRQGGTEYTSLSLKHQFNSSLFVLYRFSNVSEQNASLGTVTSSCHPV